MSNRTKVTLNQGITAALWTVAAYLLFSLHFWYLAAGILALHTVELYVTGYRRGIDAGYTPVETITLTLVFGYTWWLYLQVK